MRPFVDRSRPFQVLWSDSTAPVVSMLYSTFDLNCLAHFLVTKMQQFTEAGIAASAGAGTGTNLALSFSGTNTNPKHYQAAMKQLAGYLQEIAQGHLNKFVDEKTFAMLQTSTLHSLENALKSSPSSTAMMELGHVMKELPPRLSQPSP